MKLRYKILFHLKKYKFHYFTSLVLITLVTILTIFNLNVFIRLGFSFKFTFDGIAYYFQKIFLASPETPYTAFNYIIDNNQLNIITSDINVFLVQLEAYFKMLINFTYLANLFNSLSLFTVYFQIAIVVIIFVVLAIYLSILLFDTNKDPLIVGKRRGLVKYELLKAKYLLKIKVHLLSYLNFLKAHKYYLLILGFIILLFSNLITLILEGLAYLFIGIGNFILFPQMLFEFIVSTISTFYPVYLSIPTFIWLIIIFIAFVLLRKRHAKNKIYSFQDKNEVFCNEFLGVANLTTGVMESGKDSFNTEVAITMQRIFKNKFKEIMNYYRALFYDFDFKDYETFIDEAKASKNFEISLQIKAFFKDLKDLRAENKIEDMNKLIQKYKFPLKFLDYKKTVYNNSEPISELDMMSEYGQSYYLYNDNEPNVYSNIAMRFSYLKENNEYLSDFDFDIFNENSLSSFIERSHYSKIWQLDTWRLGLRFNKNTGLSDCGIYNLSEGGKERGNMYTNAGKDRTSSEPNQKNDDFNKFVKLLRHVYTIHYYPFVMLLMNDQRVASINADLNELFEVVIRLKKTKKTSNTLWLYNSVELPILETLLNALNKVLDKYRATRNYSSLFYSFVISLTNKLTSYKARCESNFNFKKVDMTIYQGDLQINNVKPFYLIYKEVYAGAYATDCYFRFFEPLIEKRENRLFESEKYKDKYASIKEFEKQNSLLVKDIEDCNAFKPVLNDKEYKDKFLEPIKEAMIAYPDQKNLREIYNELHNKYGVEFKGYKYFCKFVKANNLVKKSKKEK